MSYSNGIWGQYGIADNSMLINNEGYCFENIEILTLWPMRKGNTYCKYLGNL